MNNWVINKIDDFVMVTRVNRNTGEEFCAFESDEEDSRLTFKILKSCRVGDLIIFSSGRVALVGRSGAEA